MKKLTIQYTIFVILLFGALTAVIISEKMNILLIDKADEKISTYLKEKKYVTNSNTEDFNAKNTKYKDKSYQKKFCDPNNNHLCFTIIYKNKKYTDDYQKNYIEGEEFLKYISNSINKKINKKYSEKVEVTIDKKLNEFNDKIKDRLIKEENLLSLSIYNIDMELSTNLKEINLTNLIKDTNNKLESYNIIPKTYSFTIIDNNNEAKYISIKNIKPELIKDNNFDSIMKDIINNTKSVNITNNNIEFENNS